MCIAIITTTHPNYALIVVNNRDEFISRPTSQPHWWTTDPASSCPSAAPILSSRDLWRPERGTWLGLARDGHIAILTNYRDTTTSVVGTRSRGAIVSGWLAGGKTPVQEQLQDVIAAGLVDYGGFTMVCGKLRRRKDGVEDGAERLAVLSNRSVAGTPLPWLGERRGETSALSNTAFDDPLGWPKIARGKELMNAAISDAVSDELSEEALIEKLFEVLSNDELSSMLEGKSLHPEDVYLQQAIPLLIHTVFVPPLGRPLLEDPGPWEDGKAFESGVYGTQRQTVFLVGWDGDVVYVERRLWDEPRAAKLESVEDVVVRFRVDGWDGKEE